LSILNHCIYFKHYI